MNEIKLTTEQWNTVIGVVTVLITGGTLILYLRDRMQLIQVYLGRGISKVLVDDGNGRHRDKEVPGFDIIIRNKGNSTAYVSAVHLCSKQSKEKVRCHFGAIPNRIMPSGEISGFSNRYVFEIDSFRRVRNNFPIHKVISEMKLQDRKKVFIFVVIELESGNLIRSKPLTIQPKELDFTLLEKEKINERFTVIN